MILDMQTMFSGTIASDGTKTGQAITATAISVNVVDQRNAATPALAEEFHGLPSWLLIQAQTAAAGGDAAKTLTTTLESDSAVTLASAPVVHASTGPIVGAAILAGAILACLRIPSDLYKRYLGLRYTVSAGFTSFNILAFITDSPQKNKIFAAGFTIDA